MEFYCNNSVVMNKTVSCSSCSCNNGVLDYLKGDTDKDGDVDLVDLGALAGHYGMTSGATWAMGDTDGDGDVDLGDLGALAGNYGRVCIF